MRNYSYKQFNSKITIYAKKTTFREIKWEVVFLLL